jgi:hypothetical protein
MNSQEYLDREDTYDLVFFLTKTTDDYLCIKIEINGWVLRLNQIMLK